MRRLAARPAVAILAFLAFASPARADNSNARILLHLASATTKNACMTLPACADMVTGGDLFPATWFAYVLVADADRVAGIAGLQFGIEYDGALNSGVDILAWTLCATLDFHFSNWPGDGTGNLIAWDSSNLCQRTEPEGFGTGVVANAGYFYMAAYSPDDLRIVPRQVDARAKVADCAAVEYIVPVSSLGFARFSAGGSDPGFNPCGTTPLPLQCSISGPTSVPQQTVSQFSVVTNGSAPSHEWSITGQGAITGSTTGSTVTVNAGPPGSFQLVVTVTSGGDVTQCEFDVTVTSAQACVISGPDLVLQGSEGHAYSVTSDSPGATFLWSISGSGTLTSPASGSAVTVTAGSAGSYTLSVAVTANGFTGTCQKTVDVSEEASCLISGPANVIEGSSGHVYSVTSAPPADSWEWSISGNGVISGSTTGSTASVIAGSPGSFVLSVTTTSGSLSANCQTMVTVSQGTSPTCGISGPNAVLEGQQNIQYQASSSYSSVNYSWSITGNGTLTGSTTSSVVHLTAGTTGAFTLRLIAASPAVSDTCEKVVTVSPTPVSGPGLNNNAKILVHLVGPTTKNACTRAAALPACGQIVNEGSVGPYYFAHVLVAGGYTNGALLSGVAGVDFGIIYNNTLQTGVDIYSWHLCADNEIPTSNWPESGGSNRVTWDPSTRCQRFEPGGTGTGVVATPGYFYMGAYSPDALMIVKPAGAEAMVHDCQGYPSTIHPFNLGTAVFGGGSGWNPCGQSVNVQTTTWGRIKALFRPEE